MVKRALVQTGLRLESKTIDRLRHGDRGLSDEIRDRIERTFKEDQIDPVTREFRDGLINIAELLRLDFGAEWHNSTRAHQAFAAALVQRLAAYAPPPDQPSAAVEALFDQPETIGQLRERDDRRAHAYQHLEAAQKGKTGKLLRHIKGKGEKS
jgi:hypothetical protein